MSEPTKRVYEFGPFRLDPSERLLLRDGEPVALTPKAFDTLLILVEKSGRLVLKDDLMKRLWPDTYVEEGGLTRNISVLRKLLGGDSIDSQYIETLPKRGYRFVMSVRQFQGDELVIRRAKVRIVTEEEVEAPEPLAAGRDALALHGKARSLAVLPFRLLGGEPAEQYLGMGLTDVLITRLTNLRRIIVRPTSAVIHLSDGGRDAASCGRQLQVELVLEGTIQRLSDRVRVTVQLVGVEQAAPLWAEIFDEELADIFEIEDRVSKQLASALMLRLTDAERRSLRKQYTRDTEAYQSYLRGRYFWNRRTPESIDKAIECFRHAIDLDGDYALAYAGLADCYNIAGFWVYLPPVEAFPRAAEAAVEALRLDDELAEAHASLGWARLHFDWERGTAAREYRRAIELNPGYATAHQWYALLLMQEARFDEALPELKRAQEIDPLSLSISFNMGLLSIFTGRYTEAVAQLKRTIELEPNYSIARNFLGLSYFYASMFEESIQEYRRCVEQLRSSAHLTGLATGYALPGRTAEARAVLEEVLNGSYAYVSPTGLAQAYLHLGEKDRALECLERACEERDPWVLWNKVNPVFESIRSEPRFRELLRRVGLEA